MFQGFTPEAVEFLWGIKFNNNREWFLPRKEQFLALVDRPMRELGSEIFDAIAAAYPKTEDHQESSGFSSCFVVVQSRM